jgi:hypothetical protein
MRRNSPAHGALFLLGALLAPLSLAGCGSSSSGGGTTDPVATTVLVYVLGSDLESRNGNATNSIKEMMVDGSTANMKVVVQTGGSNKNKDKKPANRDNMQPDEIDWTHVQRYFVNKGSLMQVDDLGAETPTTNPDNRYPADPDPQPAVNMGSATTLANFVKWGVETYPAGKYIVVVWAHGGGVNGGISEDETTKSGMTVPQISVALESVSDEEGVWFEIIGFDACLMATAEVAASLDSSSRYMVASQDIIPGTSWAYIPFLNYVAGNPGASGKEIGEEIAQSYKSKCLTKDDEGSNPMDNPTLSVIDLSKMDAVSNATNDFATQLATYAQRADGWMQIAQARARSLDWSTSAFFNESLDLVDMGTFVSKVVNNIYKNVGEDYLLARAEAALSNAINAAVVFKIGEGSNGAATGLSLFFPSILSKYPDKSYPANTSIADSPYFAAYYTNGKNGMVQAFYKYYTTNSTTLEALLQWNSAAGPLAATINNDFDYALAAHYATNCAYYEDNDPTTTATTGSCYDGMQIVQSFTQNPLPGGGWTVDFTYDAPWPYLAGSAATSYPVVMLPDQAAGSVLGNFSSYLIPAFYKVVGATGNEYMAGFLAVEEVFPAVGGPAFYRFNGFRGAGAEMTPGKPPPLKDGQVYALGVSVRPPGSENFKFLRSSNEVTVAGGTLSLGTRANTGGSFNYFVVDLTGAIQRPGAPVPYTSAN